MGGPTAASPTTFGGQFTSDASVSVPSAGPTPVGPTGGSVLESGSASPCIARGLATARLQAGSIASQKREQMQESRQSPSVRHHYSASLLFSNSFGSPRSSPFPNRPVAIIVIPLMFIHVRRSHAEKRRVWNVLSVCCSGASTAPQQHHRPSISEITKKSTQQGPGSRPTQHAAIPLSKPRMLTQQCGA